MDGLIFKAFTENQRISKKAQYEGLGRSKQNFYQLFGSAVFSPDTVRRIEAFYEITWDEIKRATGPVKPPKKPAAEDKLLAHDAIISVLIDEVASLRTAGSSPSRLPRS